MTLKWLGYIENKTKNLYVACRFVDPEEPEFLALVKDGLLTDEVALGDYIITDPHGSFFSRIPAETLEYHYHPVVVATPYHTSDFPEDVREAGELLIRMYALEAYAQTVMFRGPFYDQIRAFLTRVVAPIDPFPA